MQSSRDRRHGLTRLGKLTLFLVSYIPLFLIIIFQQFYKNSDYLSFGGFNSDAWMNFAKKFGVATTLIIISVLAVIFLMILLQNLLERAEESGEISKVVDVENKNSESIAYLFTYIIPFVFQDPADPAQLIPIITLMCVTYTIYVNSSMILINPTLSFWYSLYHVEVENLAGAKKKIIILTKEKFMEEGDLLKMKRIAHRLYFGIDLGRNDE
ncbi:hypothetical protein [Pseudomonas sp. AL03]|uniref:hypothetical protein n=1 Tax=Pseudomonas sp. AL03 TaxID=3042230 RepID=UPI00249AED15|nr:hypothetical protein [Pseudomonas sp. AL03]MDI3270839.1 hypothetical protein [Pseudomonas sp. AL03]